MARSNELVTLPQNLNPHSNLTIRNSACSVSEYGPACGDRVPGRGESDLFRPSESSILGTRIRRSLSASAAIVSLVSPNGPRGRLLCFTRALDVNLPGFGKLPEHMLSFAFGPPTWVIFGLLGDGVDPADEVLGVGL